MNTMTEINLTRLHELADLQHPHMKGDNHTRKLIDMVYNGDKLTTAQAFDCGKYYQRMLEQLRHMETNKLHDEYLHAILAFKWACE